ncbi:TauD/TfdA family dioxygenase [Kordiimonas aestuarii]|uniref:TauD/TfdA family dioxygenase n=1 Tax=Kordiimonas aestuarii TaxID=1005925 RepID=UPI0021D28F2A|nr:TauD/TfdA family dioxygenase [Kordiimonas aestuarii]
MFETIDLAETFLRAGGPAARQKKKITARIAAALNAYPYFAKVKGFHPGGDKTEIISLTEWMAEGQSKQALGKVSFTTVSIRPDALERAQGVTAYSRTHLPLSPHTDSTYLPRPHELVGFQCVIAAREGGENTMVPVDDILLHLSDEDRTRLSEPAFPFGRFTGAILRETGRGMLVRYYRAQIDRAAADDKPLSAADIELLDRFDKLLDRLAHDIRFALVPGEAVVMNNAKVLHGRTGFASDSRRTLFRVRHHADFDAHTPKTGFWARLLSPSSEAVAAEWDGDDAIGAEEEIASVAAPGATVDPAEVLAGKLKASPDDVDLMHTASDIFLSTGRFRDALAVNARLLRQQPDDYKTHVAQAGLYEQAGDAARAQDHQRLAAQTLPFVVKDNHDPLKPTILRSRGLQGPAYTLNLKSGFYKPVLEGGHFSLRHLMLRKRYNFIVQNVFDEARPLADDVPKVDLVLNTMACADRLKGSLEALEKFVAVHDDLPLINHPTQVLATTRDENARRLGVLEGVVFPTTLRLAWPGGEATAVLAQMEAAKLKPRVIARPTGTHTGVGVVMLHSEDEIRRYFAGAQPGREYHLIEYHDIADEHGLYRKSRTFCIDGRYFPVASLTHNSWNVHSGDRYTVMDKSPAMQAREQDYLRDMPGTLGAANMARLEKVRDLVELDFFGVDFTVLPDGKLFIFECNAAMRHNYDHAGNFPYTRVHLDAVSNAFEAMVNDRIEKGRA